MAIGFFVILSLKANANRDEIKGRKGKDAIDQIRHSVAKHYDWFALVNKYLWGKISRTSLKLTEIWPISDHFLNKNTTASLCITVQFFKQKYYCITVHYRTVCISENCFGQTVQTGQQTLGHLELFFGLCPMADAKLNPWREIIPKISKAELWFLCMKHCIIVWSFNQIAKTVFNLQSGQKIGFSYVTREIIWINMQELWFLCMICRLNVLYECMKFRWNTSNSYQVVERTWNSITNDQREITPKNPKQSPGSCAWHVVWMCFTSVWSFVEISQTVIKL